jgi:hypothetical protein
MAISGVPGATYTFNFALQGDVAASYIKVAASPRSAQGGGNTYAGNPDMMREVKLGSFDPTLPSHHTFHETTPDYDLKEYETFPGADYAATGHWRWVCPAAGEYFITLTSNCDVPVMDDVESHLGANGQPAQDSIHCSTSWSMDLHVEEMATEMTLPIIIVSPPDDAAAGSPAQQVAATTAAVAQPAQTQNLNHMASTPAAEITPAIAEELCELPVELMCEAGVTCEEPDPAIMEACAQMAMAFPMAPALAPLLPLRDPSLAPLPPLPLMAPLPGTGGHRRTQRGAAASTLQPTLTHLTAKHIQYRAPNREAIEEQHRQDQRHACMRHGLKQHECPGANVVSGGGGRRRLLAAGEPTDHHGLTWDEEMDIVQTGAKVGATHEEHAAHLLGANRRALNAEKELAELRQQLADVTRQRNALLQR